MPRNQAASDYLLDRQMADELDLVEFFEDELLEDGEDSDGLPEKDAADHG